jgi:FAD synthase
MMIPRLSAKDRMPDALRGGVVALGNFDGFLLGWRRRQAVQL